MVARANFLMDQTAFRAALFTSSARFVRLPDAAHCRGRDRASRLSAPMTCGAAGDEAACVVVHSHCIADGPNRSVSCDE